MTTPQISHSALAAGQSGKPHSLYDNIYLAWSNLRNSDWQNGSPPSHPGRRPRSSKTSRNWCWRVGRGCATSSNTKVSSQLVTHRPTFRPDIQLQIPTTSNSNLTPSPINTCTSNTDTKVVYRRYASLFFIAATDPTDNELITLEIVHRYVEQMDKYYGNVCELDIIFNFQKAYFILDELVTWRARCRRVRRRMCCA